MNISEIKEKINQGIKIENLGIEVIKYISFNEKVEICDEIISKCIVEKDGIKVMDYSKKLLSIDLAYIAYYSNIDGLDIENPYDYLIENGIVEYIKNNMNPKEMEFINDVVDNSIKEIKENFNSIEAVVSRSMIALNDIIKSHIPNEKQVKSFTKGILKDINKTDWSKAAGIKSFLESIINKVNEKRG